MMIIYWTEIRTKQYKQDVQRTYLQVDIQAGKLALARSPMRVKFGRASGQQAWEVELCIGYIRDCPVWASAKKF